MKLNQTFCTSIILLLCLGTASVSKAQLTTFTGHVLDRDTKEPLPFVSVAIKGKQSGTLTNIDGKYTLTGVSLQDTFVVNYVGYKKKLVPVAEVNKQGHMTIFLETDAYELAEVKIYPKENPAHRIIQAVLNNKKQNNWERIPEFTYKTYNRFHITNADKDTLKDTALFNPGIISISLSDSTGDSDSFFNEQHLFITESVVETNFKAPNKRDVTIVGSKVSGIKDPRFSLLAGTFNDFNIYNDFIDAGGKKVLSPVAYGTLNKYNFLLEDTIWLDKSRKDTVFVISYEPKTKTLFNGFKGVLYINSDGYAIQDVIANPTRDVGGFNVKIRQQYEKVEDKYWFPMKVNADYMFANIYGQNKMIVGVDRSYTIETNFNPGLRGKDFRGAQIEIADDAIKKDSVYWEKMRIDTLSQKDITTYHVIDSIGEAQNITEKLKFFEAIANMRLPIGPVDIDLTKIILANGYEKIRLGLGLLTNDKISPYFQLGVYGGYGFKDKAFKYGGHFSLTPFYGSFFRLKLAYDNNLAEFAGRSFLLDNTFAAHERLRRGLIGNFVTEEKSSALLRLKLLKYLQTETGINVRNVNVNDPYYYAPSDKSTGDIFHFTEATASFRYAYKEKIFSALGKSYSLGTKFPILWLDVTQGFKGPMAGEFDYTKLDVKIEETLPVKLVGASSFILRAGKVFGDVPLFELFNGYGSRVPKRFWFAQYSFATMQLNEFMASEYAALFYTHSFGKYLFKIGKKKPVVSLHQGLAFGRMSNTSSHALFPYKVYEKGYFESGLTIHDILTYGFANFGIGAFYRYGPYAYAKPIDNIAVRFTISSPFLGQ